jgi:hypothetical protein
MSYLSTALVFRAVVVFFTLAGAVAWHWFWPGWVAGFGLIAIGCSLTDHSN